MADDNMLSMRLEQMRKDLWPFRLCLVFVVLCLLSIICVAIANAILVDPWPAGTNFNRCEKAIPDQLLREPWNAVSNFGYIWAGCYMMMASAWDLLVYHKLMRIYRDRTSEDELHGPHNYNVADFCMNGFCLGISLTMVGVASFIYHACAGKCERDGFYDVYAIYVTVCYLLVNAILIFVCVSKCIQPSAGDTKKVIFINVLFVIIYIVCAVVWLDYQKIIEEPLGGTDNTKFLLIGLFAFLVVTFITSVVIARCRQLAPNYDKQTLPVLAFFLITGLVSWAPEEIFDDCSPVPGDFFFQLHAYWHVGLSIAVLSAYAYLRALSNKTIELHGGFKAHLFLKEIGDWDDLQLSTEGSQKKPEL